MAATTFQLGQRRTGTLLPIPADMLKGETEVGAIYEVHIETKGIPNPQLAAETLLKELPKHFPTIKILWIAVEDNTIKIQFQGSPISWELLLMLLPLILGAIGIAAVLIAVYLIVGGPALWIVLLLGFGLFALFILPKIPEVLKAVRRRIL